LSELINEIVRVGLQSCEHVDHGDVIKVQTRSLALHSAVSTANGHSDNLTISPDQICIASGWQHDRRQAASKDPWN